MSDLVRHVSHDFIVDRYANKTDKTRVSLPTGRVLIAYDNKLKLKFHLTRFVHMYCNLELQYYELRQPTKCKTNGISK